MDRDIKEAVDYAFDHIDLVIVPQEIAYHLRHKLLKAIQQEIDSRFDANGKLKAGRAGRDLA